MIVDNKTIAITGVIVMGVLGILIGYKELALAISGGLLGLINVKPLLPDINSKLDTPVLEEDDDESEPP